MGSEAVKVYASSEDFISIGCQGICILGGFYSDWHVKLLPVLSQGQIQPSFHFNNYSGYRGRLQGYHRGVRAHSFAVVLNWRKQFKRSWVVTFGMEYLLMYVYIICVHYIFHMCVHPCVYISVTHRDTYIPISDVIFNWGLTYIQKSMPSWIFMKWTYQYNHSTMLKKKKKPYQY